LACGPLSPGEHDGEDNQDGDGPDVHRHLDHGQEAGLQHDEQGGHAGEGQDQPQGGMDQVAADHDHQRTQQDDGTEHQKDDLHRGHDWLTPIRVAPGWARRWIRA
jgi:hypothetical protein